MDKETYTREDYATLEGKNKELEAEIKKLKKELEVEWVRIAGNVSEVSIDRCPLFDAFRDADGQIITSKDSGDRT